MVGSYDAVTWEAVAEAVRELPHSSRKMGDYSSTALRYECRSSNHTGSSTQRVLAWTF
jgi:hypothetical protein